ncbi:MAG: tetratricopeptide repeat-containing sensor histidine kinase [Spirosomataceae bacterium]|jgi:signal transduction histidine kinase
MKKLLIIILSLLPEISMAQTKTSVNALIDQTMHFYESKKDSIKINAERIRSEAQKLNLQQEELYYYRFMGFYYEYDNQPDKALQSYLRLLNESEKRNFVPEKYQALGDIVSIYFNQNQQKKAREIILKAINDAQHDKPKDLVLSTFYNNMGMIYAQENKVDSALLMYNKSLVIKNKIGDPVPIADLKTNIASLYLRKGNYVLAEKLVKECFAIHKTRNMTEDLWFDLISFANIYLGTSQLSKALQNALEAEKIAQNLKSKPKELDTYEVLSKIYESTGNYPKATYYLKQYGAIKDEIINIKNSEKIAELQEQYEAEKKQRINTELTHNLSLETEKKRIYLFGLVLSLLAIGMLIHAYWKNRQKNRIIEGKNRQLAKLNTQKNHLISMVSHDLKTPFLSIRALGYAYAHTAANQNGEFIKDIVKSSEQGLKMISEILENEKFGENALQIEKIAVYGLIDELKSEFEPLTAARNIQIKLPGDKDSGVLTDKLLLKSALQNVLSNAIKYSPQNGTIYCETQVMQDKFEISIRDQGPGLNEKRTKDEYSSGKGLGIVKRIMQELGGNIETEWSDQGTAVKLRLPVE